MDNNNVYTIKLNAKHLAKWTNFLFIVIIIRFVLGLIKSIVEKSLPDGQIVLIFDFIVYGITLLEIYCLFNLSKVEANFKKAALISIAILIFNIFSAIFINETILLSLHSSIWISISIVPPSIYLYCTYLEYQGFKKLVEEFDEVLASKWKKLWYISLTSTLLLMIVAISAIQTLEEVFVELNMIKSLAFISILGAGIAIYEFIYRLIILNKTTNLFRNLEND